MGIKELIDNNANILQVNKHKENGLHIAAKLGIVSIVTYLIENTNLNINAQNIYGNTPLHNAIFSCSYKQPIEAHIQIIKILISNDQLNVNLTSNCGSILHSALNAPFSAFESLCVHPDIDFELKNRDQKTVEQIATEENRSDILNCIKQTKILRNKPINIQPNTNLRKREHNLCS